MKKTISTLLIASLSGTALVACGAKVEESAQAPNITTTNCGVEETYPRPQKAVPYDVSAIEKMFALGLAEQLRGIVLPKTVSSVIEKSPYKEDYAKVETLSDDVLSQETLVNAQADWAFAGWQAGFSQERGVTPDSLHNIGINSYLQEETCYNFDKADGGTTADPLQAIYRDLENLGNIFGVEEKAQTLVADLQRREETLRQKTSSRTHRPSVFVYDSGTDEPYTAGKRTALNSVIELAGGRSVTADVDARFTTVGWESIVKSEPETILVIDYNKQPVEEKIDYLKNHSPIKDSPAVKNNRIRVIDYGEAISNPRNISAAESLSEYLAKGD